MYGRVHDGIMLSHVLTLWVLAFFKCETMRVWVRYEGVS